MRALALSTLKGLPGSPCQESEQNVASYSLFITGYLMEDILAQMTECFYPLIILRISKVNKCVFSATNKILLKMLMTKSRGTHSNNKDTPLLLRIKLFTTKS